MTWTLVTAGVTPPHTTVPVTVQAEPIVAGARRSSRAAPGRTAGSRTF